MSAAAHDREEPRLIEVAHQGERLGFVAIDSTIRGRARGGLRLADDLSAAEIGDAAHSMTLKYGLLGLPQGGAKAGVRGDPTAPLTKRRESLLKFATAIEPMLRERTYIPDADMGTTAADIRWMLEAIGVAVFYREWRDALSGRWTACSVAGATKAALEHGGQSLAGKSVAIEGFGAVGASVARLLTNAGAQIVAVSTSHGAIYDSRGLDVDRVLAMAETDGHLLVERYPAERLARERLLELPVDILSPCARRHSIHSGNVASVDARLIAPGANNPVSAEAEAALIARGVRCLPDFVCNCGGVLGGTMAFASIPGARIAPFVDDSVRRITDKLLVKSEQTNAPLRAVAEGMALERSERMRAEAARPDARGRMLELALEAHRRGWIPGWATAAASAKYFDRLLGS